MNESNKNHLFHEDAEATQSLVSTTTMNNNSKSSSVHALEMDRTGNTCTTLEPDPVMETRFPMCFFDAPLLSQICTLYWSPLILPLTCCGCVQVPERQHVAVLYYGKYHASIQNPGIHFVMPCGQELRTISTATRTMDMKDLKVVDARGNPVIMSAVVTFRATSAKRARIDVANPWPNPSWKSPMQQQQQQQQERGTYLQLQAQAVLKQVASQFPYEAPPGMPSLQTEGSHMTRQLVQLLQQRVAITGAEILSFDLVDLSYAPEIAPLMLVRQQASALVDARKLIVSAAVEMTQDALDRLEARPGEAPLRQETKDAIVTNLLTVICSSEAATPVIQTSNSSSNNNNSNDVQMLPGAGYVPNGQ